MHVRPRSAADWPAVARIYALGLASGVATSETGLPSRETWDAAHLEANEPSLPLHEAAGFRVVGRRERIAQRDGVWLDTLLLELRLP